MFQNNVKKQKIEEKDSYTESFISLFKQSLVSDISTIETSIKSKYLKIMELEEIVRRRDDEIESLKVQMNSSNDRKRIESLESELCDKRDLIRTLKSRLEERSDNYMQEAREKNDKYRRHIEDIEINNKDLSDKLSMKESEVESLSEDCNPWFK